MPRTLQKVFGDGWVGGLESEFSVHLWSEALVWTKLNNKSFSLDLFTSFFAKLQLENRKQTNYINRKHSDTTTWQLNNKDLMHSILTFPDFSECGKNSEIFNKISTKRRPEKGCKQCEWRFRTICQKSCYF